jgi:hypothetical protein
MFLESTWAHVAGALFLLAFLGSGLVTVGGSAAAADARDELDLASSESRRQAHARPRRVHAEDRAAGHN